MSITRCIQPPADAIWFAGWWIPWLCFHQVVGPEPVISLPCGTKCFWNGYQLGGRIKDYTKRNPKKTRHFLPVVTLLQKSSSQQQVDRCFFPRQSAWRVGLPQRSSFELKIYNILNSKRPLFASDGRQNRNELPHNLLQRTMAILVFACLLGSGWNVLAAVTNHNHNDVFDILLSNFSFLLLYIVFIQQRRCVARSHLVCR
jgi:hypothetical protein